MLLDADKSETANGRIGTVLPSRSEASVQEHRGSLIIPVVSLHKRERRTERRRKRMEEAATGGLQSEATWRRRELGKTRKDLAK